MSQEEFYRSSTEKKNQSLKEHSLVAFNIICMVRNETVKMFGFTSLPPNNFSLMNSWDPGWCERRGNNMYVFVYS